MIIWTQTYLKSPPKRRRMPHNHPSPRNHAEIRSAGSHSTIRTNMDVERDGAQPRSLALTIRHSLLKKMMRERWRTWRSKLMRWHFASVRLCTLCQPLMINQSWKTRSTDRNQVIGNAQSKKNSRKSRSWAPGNSLKSQTMQMSYRAVGYFAVNETRKAKSPVTRHDSLLRVFDNNSASITQILLRRLSARKHFEYFSR